MANPVIGSCVKFVRASDNVEFNALVLTDDGPGYVSVLYIDTTVAPVAILTTPPIEVVSPGVVGFVIG